MYLTDICSDQNMYKFCEMTNKAIYSFIHSFIYSFIHSFIHEMTDGIAHFINWAKELTKSCPLLEVGNKKRLHFTNGASVFLATLNATYLYIDIEMREITFSTNKNVLL